MSDINPIIIGAFVLLLVLETLMFFFIWKTSKRITKFFNGTKAESIEKVLEYEFKRMKKNEDDIKQLIENMKWIEGIARKSISKVSAKRFNAFKGIGGDQSFSIALLDSANDGIVISSFHSNEGTRVYTKPVLKGKPRYHLAEEETEVLKEAIEVL